MDDNAQGETMAYDVTAWKTNDLIDFELPIDALYNISADLIRHGYGIDPPVLTTRSDGVICGQIRVGSTGWINGELPGDGWMKVQQIEIHGEGSATYLFEIIQPAFALSRGLLIATRIWAGGDSVDRITVRDGVVTSEPVVL